MKGTNWKIYFGIEIVFQFIYIYLNKATLNTNNENIKLKEFYRR